MFLNKRLTLWYLITYAIQGRKILLPKLLYDVHICNLVSEDNFYRLLDQALDLGFLYQSTKSYYGREGQESIDPVVFFITIGNHARAKTLPAMNTKTAK
ncbi:MAG: hypothetical protein LBI82_00520 [Dysgonamonadaceae bacterium]|nr:hypothetical protein [Dysgonamonadaceae bacterium]